MGDSIPSYQIECCTNTFAAGGRNDCICFSMYRTTELVTFSAGDFELFTNAITKLVAIDASTGRTVVAGGNDFVVSYNDSTIMSAAAGGTLQHGLGNIQIVVDLINAVHK